MTGAQIKNALLRAAYRAAKAGKPIEQATLVAACEDECEAAGKVVRSGGPGATRRSGQTGTGARGPGADGTRR